jgi:hypothetical protein
MDLATAFKGRLLKQGGRALRCYPSTTVKAQDIGGKLPFFSSLTGRWGSRVLMVLAAWGTFLGG